MKKRYISVVLAIAIVAVLTSMGITLAWLAASSTPVTNTFTVGKIEITLKETKGNQFQMIPGTDHTKDPIVTVKSGSEPCWLFFRATKSADFDSFMTFETAEGWLPLSGEEGVFYREVPAVTADLPIRIIKDNKVTIKDTVTEEMLNALAQKPTVQFTAYAVQKEGIPDAATAWNSFEKEE